MVQAVGWAGEQLGEESRAQYCWPAVELVLTRAASVAVCRHDTQISRQDHRSELFALAMR